MEKDMIVHPEKDIAEATPTYQLIDRCYEKARYYQSVLDSGEVAGSEYIELAHHIIEELDHLYPYNGEPVYMSGQAFIPFTDEEGNVRGEGFAAIEGCAGFHQGFNTINWEDEDGKTVTRIVHQVLVGERRDTTYITAPKQSRLLYFFELESAVFSMEELEETMLSNQSSVQEENNSHDIVESYSKRFVDLLLSTKFRRMPHRQQKRLVDDFMIEAEDAAKVRDMQVIAEPLYAYTPFVTSGDTGVTRHYMPLNLSSVVVSGTCVALDALVTAELKAHPIRRNADAVFLRDGLCLVVDPDEDTRQGLNLAPDQVLYIPTQSQSFEAAIYAE